MSDIIEKLSPIVKLYPNDDVSPSSIDFYLKDAKLYSKNTGFLFNVNERIPTANELNDQNNFLENTDLEIRKGMDNLDNVPCYYRNIHCPVVNHRWIQYWFFYPYNSWVSTCFKNKGLHEADWEHITVEYNVNSEVISRIYFARHGQRESVWVNRNDIEFSDTHPIVYSARNGHASYQHAGRYMRGPIIGGKHIKWLGFGFLDDVTSDKGDTWVTENNLVSINSEDLSYHSWFYFRGNWGRINGILGVYAQPIDEMNTYYK